MKWSERGPVAWPLIRRSRFIRELSQQRATFEKRIGAEQRNTRLAEAQYAREKAAHEADLRNVLDYRGAAMQRHDDYRNDVRIFSTRVSNNLIHQMCKASDPRQVAELVARDLIGQMLTATKEL